VADGTQFKGTIQCGMTVLCKVLTNLEYRKVGYRNFNGNYGKYNEAERYLSATEFTR
jgi:hypothetical protein